jgi:DNA (cytosine-5)-methyltransferase 1
MTKPPYRVPSMAEIKSGKWNGFDAASTFSGCGGSSLGYRMAGFRLLWANEFVPAARETYLANAAPYTVVDGSDVRALKVADVLTAMNKKPGELDLFDGSPPCSSFSLAGKRSGGWGTVKKYSDVAQRTDDLFFEFARLLEGIRPRTFVAENVAGLVRGVAVGYFNDVLSLLRSLGYRVAARLLDAQWLGVPQQRTRIIFVGVREDLGFEPAHPEPQQFRYTVADACPWVKAVRTHSNRDVYYRAAGDAPATTIMAHDYKTSETSIYGGGFVESDVPLDAFDGVDISRFAIGAEWDKLEEGEQSSRFFNLIRADRDKPSPPILASHGGGSIASVTHPTEKRKFSIPELRRLCSFPDDFVLTGSYEQQWERLGRAVPPVMMRAVAETVRDKILIPWRAAKEARER